MAQVHFFTFSPFSENTYIIYDETKECIIIDPGCYTAEERKTLSNFITEHELTPVRLINTHCHLDHVFGNRYVAETYQLPLEIHEGELPVLESVPVVCQMYGIPNVQQSPDPDPNKFIQAGDLIQFGNTELSVLFTPGHSPASVSFYCSNDNFIIGGDVLFQGSIGRTDLPGGDMNTLMQSIFDHFLTLPDSTIVYSGHGNPTTVGAEKASNPFILNHAR
ncbi:MBL fold metallo-hydrolase [Aureispira anguillae]|uniref:MBL fold metallo-hydrolase n=1 Tax=Aureispira anguillae TaxID=2864201 RepID=A0A916DWY2_9BACT|nr:MBL fold metallo-hydrolase [Aureispira anguillae]BDS15190.1 MBL fold metallo-hydrolase [Aureispira anguillae]